MNTSNVDPLEALEAFDNATETQAQRDAIPNYEETRAALVAALDG